MSCLFPLQRNAFSHCQKNAGAKHPGCGPQIHRYIFGFPLQHGHEMGGPPRPPRPPDQIAPLVQLLPQGCVHIFWVQARSKGNIYIYIAGNHGFSPENVMMVLGYGSLNPDASHVHSWLILKYLEVLAKLKYTGLSWGSRWRAIQLPSALCPPVFAELRDLHGASPHWIKFGTRSRKACFHTMGEHDWMGGYHGWLQGPRMEAINTEAISMQVLSENWLSNSVPWKTWTTFSQWNCHRLGYPLWHP